MTKKDIKIIIPDGFVGKYNGSHIRWNDHKNEHIIIMANNESYQILIEDVDVKKQMLCLSYNNKSINISMAQIGNKIKEQMKYGTCYAGKLLYLIDNNVLLGDAGHNALIYFKYDIGLNIKNNKNDYVITGIFMKKDQYSNRKYYNIHCNKCGWDGYISETSIDNNCQCGCCSKEIIVTGINDIATTDSWAIDYFVYKSDVNKYHNSSDVCTDLQCPFCGQRYKNVNIRTFFKNIYHLNCPCNKAYASYPERFVFNLLKMLNTNNVIPQATKKILYWANNYRYDFYIPDKFCIIETHGIQHYQDSFSKVGGKTCQQEYDNDIAKEYLAKQNNIINYIILDCRISNMNWIKQSIMNSSLPTLFCFSENDIDWKECDKKSRSELLVDVCNEYMNNITSTKASLAKQFGIKPDTVRRYLIQGKKLSICNFDANSIREKLSNNIINSVIFIYKDGILVRACTSTLDVHKKSFDIFGEKVSEHKICYCMQNNYSINGYTIIRNNTINSYKKYIDYLCDCI